MTAHERRANALTRPLLVVLLMLVMSAALLRGCWRAPLYQYDDKWHLYYALGVPPREWLEFKRITFFPVTQASFALDLFLFGRGPTAPWMAEESRTETGASGLPEGKEFPYFPIPTPGGMRVMSALYHALGGLMLWQLLRRLGAGDGLAAVVALAWTGHPMACESVCWVSERKSVLTACFGFGSLLAWTAGRHHLWRWPLVWLLYGFAVLSKPTALGLLPIFFFLEVLDPRWREFRWREGRHWICLAERLSGPALISAFGIWAALYGHGKELVTPPGGSPFTALLTDTEIVARYAFNTLLPVNLSFFYGVEPITSPADARLWLYTLALAAVFGGMIWAARERRVLAALGILWFLGALGPNANLIAIPFWMQDRYVYLASAGLLLAAGAAIAGLAGRADAYFAPAARDSQKSRAPAPLAPVIGAGALVFFLVLSFARSPLFVSSERLILDAVPRQPNSAMARLCAAEVLKERYRDTLKNGPGDSRLAMAAQTQFNGIEACPDLYCHVDPFSLRVRQAELLPLLGYWRDAQTVLGPLPPPGMAMLKATDENKRPIHYPRAERTRGYPKHTLASAWMVLAESHIRETAAPELTADQQEGAARKAISAAREARALQPKNFATRLMEGRALIRLGDLHAKRNDMEYALRYFNEGQEALRAIPETSRAYNSARQMLEKVPPPKPPVSEPRP